MYFPFRIDLGKKCQCHMPTRFLTLDMNDSQVPSYGEDMSNYYLLLKGLFINLTSFVHMLNFVFIRGVVSFILVTGVR